ncbi:unnamed protein product [Clonostachys rosea f. rosea IK726]|uniref:Uncharacterized protein n=2 Tax=Bionectria ochroleuca TaxID=29856 RepID=A0A0B7KFE7_BIOOC|nr:unnamed protein product [Clonostachys rosea f. rosea IK726]
MQVTTSKNPLAARRARTCGFKNIVLPNCLSTGKLLSETSQETYNFDKNNVTSPPFGPLNDEAITSHYGTAFTKPSGTMEERQAILKSEYPMNNKDLEGISAPPTVGVSQLKTYATKPKPLSTAELTFGGSNSLRHILQHWR